MNNRHLELTHNHVPPFGNIFYESIRLSNVLSELSSILNHRVMQFINTTIRKASISYERACKEIKKNKILKESLATHANHFWQNIGSVLSRLTKHKADIADNFMDGDRDFSLKYIASTGSDFHKGGQQVLILTLETSQEPKRLIRVVYKPSDMY